MLEKNGIWSVFCRNTSAILCCLKNREMRKRIAFTLTEMLIALVVVAILAVLILPVVTTRAQNKSFAMSYESQVKQMLNSLTGLHVMENVPDFQHTMMYVPAEPDDYTNSSGAFINKYMKVAKYCGNSPGSCFAQRYYRYKDNDREEYTLTGDDNQELPFSQAAKGACALLKNGSSICLRPQTSIAGGGIQTIQGYIDLNGPKGPNVFGRDLRTFRIDMTEHIAYDESDPMETIITPDPAVGCVGSECIVPDECLTDPSSEACCKKKAPTGPSDPCCNWHGNPNSDGYAICHPEEEEIEENCQNHTITGPDDHCCSEIQDPKCCAQGDVSAFCCATANSGTEACCRAGITAGTITLNSEHPCCQKFPSIKADYPQLCIPPCTLDEQNNRNAVNPKTEQAYGDKWREGRSLAKPEGGSSYCCDYFSRRKEILSPPGSGPRDGCCMFEDVYNDEYNPVSASHCCRLQKFPKETPAVNELCCSWRFFETDLDGKSWLKTHGYYTETIDAADNPAEDEGKEYDEKKFDTCCPYALSQVIQENPSAPWDTVEHQDKVWKNCCSLKHLTPECCHFMVERAPEYGPEALMDIDPRTGVEGVLRQGCCGYDEFKDTAQCCSRDIDGIHPFRNNEWREVCCMPNSVYTTDLTTVSGPSVDCCINAGEQITNENHKWWWKREAKFGNPERNNRLDGCCNQGTATSSEGTALRKYPKWQVNCCYLRWVGSNAYETAADFVTGCCTSPADNPAGEEAWGDVNRDDDRNEDCCAAYGSVDDPSHNRINDSRWYSRCCSPSKKINSSSNYKYHYKDAGCCKNVLWHDEDATGSSDGEDCCTYAVDVKTGQTLKSQNDTQWFANCCNHYEDYKGLNNGSGYKTYVTNCCINDKTTANDGLRKLTFGGSPNQINIKQGQEQFLQYCCDTTIAENNGNSPSENCCWSFVELGSGMQKDFDDNALSESYRGNCCKAYGDHEKNGKSMRDSIEQITCPELWICAGNGLDRSDQADSLNAPGYGLPGCCVASKEHNDNEYWRGACCEFPDAYSSNADYRSICCSQDPSVDYTRENTAEFNTSVRGLDDATQKAYCCKPDIADNGYTPSTDCCSYFHGRSNYRRDNDNQPLSERYQIECCELATGDTTSATDYCSTCDIRWKTGEEKHSEDLTAVDAQWQYWDFSGCCKSMYSTKGDTELWQNNCCSFVGDSVQNINDYYGSHENFRQHCCNVQDVIQCGPEPNDENLNAYCCGIWGETKVKNAGFTSKCCGLSDYASGHNGIGHICHECSSEPKAEDVSPECCAKWTEDAIESKGLRTQCCATSFGDSRKTKGDFCNPCSQNPTDADAAAGCCPKWTEEAIKGENLTAKCCADSSYKEGHNSYGHICYACPDSPSSTDIHEECCKKWKDAGKFSNGANASIKTSCCGLDGFKGDNSGTNGLCEECPFNTDSVSYDCCKAWGTTKLNTNTAIKDACCNHLKNDPTYSDYCNPPCDCNSYQWGIGETYNNTNSYKPAVVLTDEHVGALTAEVSITYKCQETGSKLYTEKVTLKPYQYYDYKSGMSCELVKFNSADVKLSGTSIYTGGEASQYNGVFEYGSGCGTCASGGGSGTSTPVTLTCETRTWSLRGEAASKGAKYILSVPSGIAGLEIKYTPVDGCYRGGEWQGGSSGSPLSFPGPNDSLTATTLTNQSVMTGNDLTGCEFRKFDYVGAYYNGNLIGEVTTPSVSCEGTYKVGDAEGCSGGTITCTPAEDAGGEGCKENPESPVSAQCCNEWATNGKFDNGAYGEQKNACCALDDFNNDDICGCTEDDIKITAYVDKVEYSSNSWDGAVTYYVKLKSNKPVTQDVQVAYNIHTSITNDLMGNTHTDTNEQKVLTIPSGQSESANSIELYFDQKSAIFIWHGSIENNLSYDTNKALTITDSANNLYGTATLPDSDCPAYTYDEDITIPDPAVICDPESADATPECCSWWMGVRYGEDDETGAAVADWNKLSSAKKNACCSIRQNEQSLLDGGKYDFSMSGPWNQDCEVKCPGVTLTSEHVSYNSGQVRGKINISVYNKDRIPSDAKVYLKKAKLVAYCLDDNESLVDREVDNWKNLHWFNSDFGPYGSHSGGYFTADMFFSDTDTITITDHTEVSVNDIVADKNYQYCKVVGLTDVEVDMNYNGKTTAVFTPGYASAGVSGNLEIDGACTNGVVDPSTPEGCPDNPDSTFVMDKCCRQWQAAGKFSGDDYLTEREACCATSGDPKFADSFSELCTTSKCVPITLENANKDNCQCWKNELSHNQYTFEWDTAVPADVKAKCCEKDPDTQYCCENCPTWLMSAYLSDYTATGFTGYSYLSGKNFPSGLSLGGTGTVNITCTSAFPGYENTKWNYSINQPFYLDNQRDFSGNFSDMSSYPLNINSGYITNCQVTSLTNVKIDKKRTGVGQLYVSDDTSPKLVHKGNVDYCSWTKKDKALDSCPAVEYPDTLSGSPACQPLTDANSKVKANCDCWYESANRANFWDKATDDQKANCCAIDTFKKANEDVCGCSEQAIELTEQYDKDSSTSSKYCFYLVSSENVKQDVTVNYPDICDAGYKPDKTSLTIKSGKNISDSKICKTKCTSSGTSTGDAYPYLSSPTDSCPAYSYSSSMCYADPDNSDCACGTINISAVLEGKSSQTVDGLNVCLINEDGANRYQFYSFYVASDKPVPADVTVRLKIQTKQGSSTTYEYKDLIIEKGKTYSTKGGNANNLDDKSCINIQSVSTADDPDDTSNDKIITLVGGEIVGASADSCPIYTFTNKLSAVEDCTICPVCSTAISGCNYLVTPGSRCCKYWMKNTSKWNNIGDRRGDCCASPTYYGSGSGYNDDQKYLCCEYHKSKFSSGGWSGDKTACCAITKFKDENPDICCPTNPKEDDVSAGCCAKWNDAGKFSGSTLYETVKNKCCNVTAFNKDKSGVGQLCGPACNDPETADDTNPDVQDCNCWWNNKDYMVDVQNNELLLNACCEKWTDVKTNADKKNVCCANDTFKANELYCDPCAEIKNIKISWGDGWGTDDGYHWNFDIKSINNGRVANVSEDITVSYKVTYNTSGDYKLCTSTIRKGEYIGSPTCGVDYKLSELGDLAKSWHRNDYTTFATWGISDIKVEAPSYAASCSNIGSDLPIFPSMCGDPNTDNVNKYCCDYWKTEGKMSRTNNSDVLQACCATDFDGSGEVCGCNEDPISVWLEVDGGDEPNDYQGIFKYRYKLKSSKALPQDVSITIQYSVTENGVTTTGQKQMTIKAGNTLSRQVLELEYKWPAYSTNPTKTYTFSDPALPDWWDGSCPEYSYTGVTEVNPYQVTCDPSGVTNPTAEDCNCWYANSTYWNSVTNAQKEKCCATDFNKAYPSACPSTTSCAVTAAASETCCTDWKNNNQWASVTDAKKLECCTLGVPYVSVSSANVSENACKCWWNNVVVKNGNNYGYWSSLPSDVRTSCCEFGVGTGCKTTTACNDPATSTATKTNCECWWNDKDTYWSKVSTEKKATCCTFNIGPYCPCTENIGSSVNCECIMNNNHWDDLSDGSKKACCNFVRKESDYCTLHKADDTVVNWSITGSFGSTNGTISLTASGNGVTSVNDVTAIVNVAYQGTTCASSTGCDLATPNLIQGPNSFNYIYSSQLSTWYSFVSVSYKGTEIYRSDAMQPTSVSGSYTVKTGATSWTNKK